MSLLTSFTLSVLIIISTWTSDFQPSPRTLHLKLNTLQMEFLCVCKTASTSDLNTFCVLLAFHAQRFGVILHSFFPTTLNFSDYLVLVHPISMPSFSFSGHCPKSSLIFLSLELMHNLIIQLRIISPPAYSLCTVLTALQLSSNLFI